MEKLFAALREKHNGFEVVDVRFLVDASEANGRNAASIDSAFAKAVRGANQIDLTTLSF